MKFISVAVRVRINLVEALVPKYRPHMQVVCSVLADEALATY
jgi:hypothetical protein